MRPTTRPIGLSDEAVLDPVSEGPRREIHASMLVREPHHLLRRTLNPFHSPSIYTAALYLNRPRSH